MPGILPMKVIKVGTSTQARIAQACDRCRSKKIRCDGLTPTCSQCSTVGFECKTSDKLSRRAFPRGYTESLEDRVRILECEIRELKDLLDGKDEKIDMLSKMHAQTPSSPRRASLTTNFGNASPEQSASERVGRDEMFKLQQPPCLIAEEGSESFFMGSSSGHAFIDCFKRKLQESGKAYSEFDARTFFAPRLKNLKVHRALPNDVKLWKALPRLASDQLVNIFFQEWAPLFPVLHRPTFLTLYEQYVSEPSKITDMKSLAQLNLVFGIAALSSESLSSENAETCESQWVKALKTFMLETSIANLQCLILAQIFCIQRGDAANLLHFKGLAVGIAQRLGLHMTQKRFVLGALTVETRKKVFWTLYTLDCFSAAAFGLPKLLREDCISCEYPVDADDEYVTEEGFKPTLPGEFTKLSSALALFRGSRVLSKVLEQNYPATTSQDLSLRYIAELDEQLHAWSDALAPHLRMEFVQDKPSVQVVSSRCPLLSLTYHYIRTLIHRPAVCANLGDRASSSTVALASSSKHIIQLVQLLDERNLSFSFCVNKNELLTVSGFGILFQALDLEKYSMLIKDNGKSICAIIELLERRKAAGAAEFKRLGCSMISVVRKYNTDAVKPAPSKTSNVAIPISEMSAHTQKQLQALADRFPATTVEPTIRKRTSKNERRTSASITTTAPNSSNRQFRGHEPRSTTGISLPTTTQPHSLSPRPSISSGRHIKAQSQTPPYPSPTTVVVSATPNLDYFQMSTEVPQPNQPQKSECPHDGAAWDTLLQSLDDLYPGASGLPYYDDLATDSRYVADHDYPGLLHRVSIASDTSWSSNMRNSELGLTPSTEQPAPRSVLSFSAESLTSCEEFCSIDFEPPTGGEVTYGGIMMPHYSPDGLSPDEMADLDASQMLVGM